MIIARPDPESQEIGEKITAELFEHGYHKDEKHPEIVFVVGGDGTFIYAVHYVVKMLGKELSDVHFYGIHTGTLGFYTDYRSSDYREFMDVFLQKKYVEITYPLLKVTYGEKEKHHAINEIRIENVTRTQKMDVYINGEHLETFRGTGMCVCTQLGSTAYNRSLGGAVMQEGLDFIEMTEIAGIHHVKYRSLEAPIILKNDTVIEFKSDSFKDALLGCDARVYPLDDIHSLTIEISKTVCVRVLRGRNVSYFDRLKSLF